MQKTLLRAIAIVAVCAASSFGQTSAGFAAISGTVRDSSGAAIVGARVVVSNPNKGVVRNLATNEAGLFTAPALVPAAGYSVSVSSAGFAAYEVKDFELQVGQNLGLNVVLQVAASATQVDVTSEAPLVEDTKTDVSQVVTQAQIQELPINGRRVDSFVLLTPGVSNDGTFGLLTFRGIAGGNSFLVDGNDTTEQFYNENAGRTRIATQLSQDAVQEFQVVSSNFTAEYGRATGGVVNSVIKSGGNDVHGSGFWFFRNRTLNARDPFAATNPPEVRHQAGGTLGGKIIKDKLFYFLNSEVSRRNYPISSSISRPGVIDANTQKFIGCGAPVNGVTPTAAQCDAINAILPRYFGIVPRNGNQELALGKMDWRPSERNSFSATFNFLHWKAINGLQSAAALNDGSAVGGNGDDSVRTRMLRLSWTSIPTTSMANEFRFGWFTDRQADDFNKNAQVGPIANIGLTVASQTNLGAGLSYLPRIDPNERRFQFADNLSWTLGKHMMKFGVDISTAHDYDYFISNQFGSYTYGSVSAFALDFSGNTTGAKNWQTFSQTFGTPYTDTTITDYTFFAQDQFRVTPNLTVNYGVRYDYAVIPQPKSFNADYPQTGKIASDNNNIAPRIGVAYTMDKGRMVIRAGYGMYYARYTGALISTLFKGNGQYQPTLSIPSTNSAAGPVFPNRLASAANAAGSTTVNFAAPDLRTPYSEQGTFAIERKLASNLVLTTSYIWSRGVLLNTVRDLNIGPLGSVATYRIADAAGNVVGTYSTPVYQGPKVNTKYNRVLQVENGGNSYYNALAVQLQRRFSRTFQASAAYTWSHAIDYNQGGGSSNLFFSGLASTYNGDYKFDKGHSTLDQRHRMVINFIAAPVFTKRTDGFSRWVVNNWQLSVLTTLGSGRPNYASINIVDSRPPNGGLNFSLNGFGGLSRVPFWPMNSLLTGATYKADARISKSLPLSERVKLTLLFEAFNITNTPVYTGIFNTGFNLTNGLLTPIANLGQPRFSNGFPDGTSARRAQVGARVVF